MTWSLHSNENFLKPLIFSNGKSQEDIVNEVLRLISHGKKIIFIQGICGTGKSAIALNIAKELGKTSVIVPIKNLQAQYQNDYGMGKKYILKNDKNKLKINVITGRKNHKCKFLEDNKGAIPKIKDEIDSKLHDIFDKKRQEIKNLISQDASADNSGIPCKVEIRENNWNKIKQYIKQNKDVNYKDFLDIKDVRRLAVAGACPYFSPVLENKYEINSRSFVNSIKKKYMGLNNKEFTYYCRRPGCSFYEQFDSYINSDVIVFNAMKYLLESSLERKPLTEVEIVDECDEFLDNFANQKSINLDRLQASLGYIFSEDKKVEFLLRDIDAIIKQIKRNPRINNAIDNEEIIPLKETGVYDMLKIILKNNYFLDDVDNESYVFDVYESAKMFEDFFNDTYITVNKKDDAIIINLVTTNLEKRFKEMIDKNKIIVLMSGTLHSDYILKSIFGLNDFEKIIAESESQGRIDVVKTGFEMDCKYSNFKCGKFTKIDYLKALDKCVEVAKKPTLVHVNAYLDLPTKDDIKIFKLNNLISREELKEIQKKDNTGKLVDDFKSGKIDVLFSTRSGRGMDFPGDKCNSIVFTKYPNPNVKDAFWKILQKTKPQQYWDFYKDKAQREFWQKIYRGLRFKDDHIYLLSPDIRVLDMIKKD